MEEVDHHHDFQHLATWQYFILYASLWIAAILSILGSACILRSIVHNKQKRKTVFHRIMFGLSLSDIAYSFTIALQPILIPGVTQLPVASGNDSTCQILGFGMMFMLTSNLYNCLLAMHFYLAVRYDGRKQMVEPYCHLLPWGIGLLFGILGFVFKSFGYDHLLSVCVLGCEETAPFIDDCPNRTYPGAFGSIGWAFTAVAVICGIVGVAFTAMVYYHARRIYANAQRYSFNGGPVSKFRCQQKRAVAWRSILYTSAFMNSFLANVGSSLLHAVFYKYMVKQGNEKSAKMLFGVLIVLCWGFPIQGFLNCVVFFHPSFSRWRKSDHESKGFLWAVGKALFSTEEPPVRGNTGQLPTTSPHQSKSISFKFPSWAMFLSRRQLMDNVLERTSDMECEESSNNVDNVPSDE